MTAIEALEKARQIAIDEGKTYDTTEWRVRDACGNIELELRILIHDLQQDETERCPHGVWMSDFCYRCGA